MTELLTPELIDSIKRQQRAWNSEFQVRGDAPKLCLQDFCAMHANVTRLLRDREAICERLELLLNAVTASEFSGIRCGDVVIDGERANWFDARDEFLSELRGGE